MYLWTACFIFIDIFNKMNSFKRFFFLILLFLSSMSFAQTIEDRLTIWSTNNAIEKLYLQLDRDSYYSGQAIWFKGYFMSLFQPSMSNSVMYVELLDNTQIIHREVFPVYGGMAPGHLLLPDSLPTGTYQLRAYSPLMLNQPGFVYNRSIMVYGKKEDSASNWSASGNRILAFFPEGGNFVIGIANKIAFKSTDEKGIPISVEGEIRDSRQQVVSTFKSVHDGMGTFTLIPINGERYTAVVKNTNEQYSLPQQTEDGIVLNVTEKPGGKQFKITMAGNNPVFRPAYITGQMQNRIVFKQVLQQNKQEIAGVIKTGDLYSGILQITVFNQDNVPLSQRITFVDNQEYILPAFIKADTLDFGQWKQNHFTIQIDDTIAGNFSISVTDADYDHADARSTNIYSSFLLSSDLRGYVHNPAYYFNTRDNAAINALELVMMTNGWTRFRWTDVTGNKLPKPQYKDPGYIRLSGKINITGTSNPLADKDVILFISPKNSKGGMGGSSRIVHTNASGQFVADSLLFYGKAKIVFSEVRGKKNKFIKIHPDPENLTRSYPVWTNPFPFVNQETKEKEISDKMDAAYLTYLKNKGILLQNVTITAREKPPLDKLDEEYSSGLFSGKGYSRQLDVREANYAGNIFEYLRERVPGLQISGEPGNYALNFRGGNLTYYMEGAQPDNGNAEPTGNNGNVTLFLNEMPANAVSLETVLVDDIALVKLFPTSIVAAGGGTALAIYTKKGSDAFKSTEAATDIITYQGFTIAKEFYNPDYKLHPESKTQDNRITLKWIPDLFIIGSNSLIPLTFYNTEHTKRFKIIAEGITGDGRMLMLEKVFDGKSMQ
jgi:hypothetical protein